MRKGNYRFNVGDFECIVISDGTLTLPPRPTASGGKEPGGVLDILCLIIKTENHTVLIDTGNGTETKPESGWLLENLEQEGIHPGDIDTIILSHGHSDHIGGNTDSQGNSVFPGARYILPRVDWEFWTSLLNQEKITVNVSPGMVAYARKNLPPIAAQFNLLDGEKNEVLPGIEIIMAPGHTPGNTVQILSSGNQQLFCLADLMHSPREFTQPDYYKMFDVSYEQAYRSRNEILAKYVKPDLPVFACHFPFPGLGHIVQKDGFYHWQPIEL